MVDTSTNSTKSVRVYYLGSGEIGLETIAALSNDPRINLVGCGTQPDRPQGRKRVMQATDIGQWCEVHQISVDKFESINNESSIRHLQSLNIDVMLVFAYGQILTQDVLDIASEHCINIHASLLPKYRGASPINAAILSGDEKTGICLIEMTRGLDSGPVYKQYEYSLNGSETYSSLSEILGALAGEHICDAICEIVNDKLEPIAQSEEGKSIVRKIKKEDSRINWNDSAIHIERMVRAYSPWPGAHFVINTLGKERKITIKEARVKKKENNKMEAGQVLQADKNGWTIVCGQDALEILKLIPNGKREMSGTDFIRGCQLEAGSFLYETDNCKQRELTNEDCPC